MESCIFNQSGNSYIAPLKLPYNYNNTNIDYAPLKLPYNYNNTNIDYDNSISKYYTNSNFYYNNNNTLNNSNTNISNSKTDSNNLATYDSEVSYEDLTFTELLGKGAFSSVYRGSLWGEIVAIKQLKIDSNNSNNTNFDKRVDSFKKEIEVMIRVRHPNLLQFLGMCMKLPNLCIITEYCPNGSLEDLLKRKQLSGKKYMKIAKEIARGINWLHHKHIMHRDIKPSNILLDKNDTCKIADFGLSHIKEMSGGKKSLGVCGTPSYMAPEVIKNLNYTYACDVYSFGVVLCEMITGVYPYDSLSASTQTFSEAICMGLRPELPKETYPLLKDLIERMWASLPRDRPGITEICSLLEEIEESMIFSSSSSNYYIPMYFDWTGEDEYEMPPDITRLLEQEKVIIQNLENDIQAKHDELLSASKRIQRAELLLANERKEKEFIKQSAEKALNQRNKIKQQLNQKVSMLKKQKEEIYLLRNSQKHASRKKKSFKLKSPTISKSKPAISITPPLTSINYSGDNKFVPMTPSLSSKRLTRVYLTDSDSKSRILLPTSILRRRPLKRLIVPPIILSASAMSSPKNNCFQNQYSPQINNGTPKFQTLFSVLTDPLT